jgi:ATP-binding cassette subfamily B protein
MHVLWNYFKVQKGLVILSLVLATAAQLMNLIDPMIFGKIIDDYALNSEGIMERDRVRGALFWLGVAIAVALGARLAKALQEYYTRQAVQLFGMQIFNDDLTALIPGI